MQERQETATVCLGHKYPKCEYCARCPQGNEIDCFLYEPIIVSYIVIQPERGEEK